MTDEYKKVNAINVESTLWKAEKEGDELEGVYVDKKTIPSALSKTGESTIYTVQKLNGEYAAFFGSKVIDENFNKIPFGAGVKIIYTGKVKSKSSGFSFKNYDIYSKQIVTPVEVPITVPSDPTPTEPIDINIDEIPF